MPSNAKRCHIEDIHCRSGSVAFCLVTVVLNAAARCAGAALKAERRALVRSIVVDILTMILASELYDQMFRKRGEWSWCLELRNI